MATEEIVFLCRFALGISGENHKIYRNRFIAGHGHPHHAIWMNLVTAGLAEVVVNNVLKRHSTTFALTQNGVAFALTGELSSDEQDSASNSQISSPNDKTFMRNSIGGKE